MKLLSKIERSYKIKKILFYSVIILTLLYVFSIPSFGESSSIIRYMIYITMALLGLCTLSYCFFYGDFRLKKEVILVFSFVIISFLGTAIYSKAFREWFSLVLLTFSFIIFVFAFKILRNKFLILNILSLSFFLFSIYFIIYFRNEFLHFDFSTRLGPPFDNQNGVAAYAIVGFSIPLYILLFWSNKLRFFHILPTLTSFLVGISTGSKTFILMVFIFVLVFLYFKFAKHKLIYLIIVGALIAFAIVLINLPFMETLKLRLISALETLFGTASKVNTSTLQRANYIDYGFYLGSKNLFFGYGVSGFSAYSGVGTYSHSNYSELLCNFGLIGFVLFYIPLIILLLKTLTNKKSDKAFILAFFAYYAIVSFSNVFYYRKIYYLVLAFLYYLTFFDPSVLGKMSLTKDIKKVVFTCESMESGGAEQVIASISNQMSSLDIEVTIIGVSTINSTESFYHLNNSIKYVTLANGSGKKINVFRRVFLLRKMIKRLQPDVVIAFLPHVIVYTRFSTFFTNIPLIVSERNNPYIDPKESVLRLFKRLSFNLADGCVFQTEDAMNFYSYKLLSKSTIIKNPISLRCDPPIDAPARNNVVLAVGRLTEQKNYKCLLTAFSIFNKSENNKYILKIYGDGPLRKEIEQYCGSLKIKDYVIFMGRDIDWHKKEYCDSMYILSSNYEGMPNSLAEAMALGIPSIATDCPTGGTKELITDSVNGYLVPVNDSKSLANKMKELSSMNNSEFFNATRNMVNDFSVSKITNDWIAFIKGLTHEICE